MTTRNVPQRRVRDAGERRSAAGRRPLSPRWVIPALLAALLLTLSPLLTAGAWLLGPVMGLGKPAEAAPLGAPCDPPVSNPVACENTLPGSPKTEWDIPGGGAGEATLQGYATEISVNKGQPVQFKVKTDAASWRIDIYRLGYYGGAGARKWDTLTVNQAQNQPDCLSDPASGLVDCGNWTVSATWNMPATAVSGIYVGKLVRPDTGGSSHIVFVVRDDTGGSDVLFQTSDTTWQAYNSYGGNSLYVGAPAGRAYKVSYNRPITTRRSGCCNGSFESWLFTAEYPMLRWLEANGYRVSYTTGVDTDRRGAELLEHKVFMTVGHDEYWSNQQRANVEAARNAGVNLTFLSGNDMFWKTRWENSIDGSNTPYRTLVSYKETHANAKIDPTPAWTGSWRDPRFSPPADGGRPEHALTGTLFRVNGTRNDAMTVPAADGKLRFWRNTAIAALAPDASATLPAGTLGYEWNEAPNDANRPAGRMSLSTTTLPINGQYLTDYGSTFGSGTATHHLTLYRHSAGALVFSSGSTQWSWGLDSTHDSFPAPTDVNMQQATVNLLADMSAQPSTLQGGLTAATKTADSTAPGAAFSAPAAGAAVPVGLPVTITGTATDTGGVVGAVEVSVDNGTTWLEASGRATWTFSWTPAAEGNVTLRARAVDDSGNIGPAATRAVVVGPRTCPCTVWNESEAPAVPSFEDTNAVNLGVKFRAEAPGEISAIRFYKGSSNPGPHAVHLWSTTGQLLGSGTSVSETPTGWQQVPLTAPVGIEANTTYVASYHAPNGGYARTEFGLEAAVNRPPLLVPASGAAGGNGVYAYGPAGTFPGSSFHSTNYWVDVVYGDPAPPGPTPTPTQTPTQTPTPTATQPGPTSTPTPSPTPTQTATPTQAPPQGDFTVTFDDRPGENQALDGQYPANLISWGSGQWYHAGPWGPLTSKSASFTGPGQTSAAFTFVSPRRLLSIEAHNGGGGPSTVTLACAGQPNVSQNVNPGQTVTISTGWTGTCASVTVGASNGWDTNFDDLVLLGGAGPTSTPTSTPAGPTATPTNTPAGPTATPTNTPAGPTATPTNTPAGPTATRTPTATATATATSTPAGPTATRTPTATPGALGCPCTLFAPSSTPAVASMSDTGAVELGVKFRSDVAGSISAIRFYKGPANTGSHVAHLWSNSGQLLGTASFTDETDTGWQTASFAQPIAITANTTYVASYHAPNGGYARNEAFFAFVGHDRGPLHAQSTGAAGGNGVYAYGPAGTFPNGSYNGTNYWVDVVLSTTP